MKREISRNLKPYFDEKTQFQYYDEYMKDAKQSRNIDDKFICLKGFASSIPLVGTATFGTEYLGGGFYFRFNGKGIVVDPGIGFVTLMHRNNIFIDDIDVVIVTHNHLDHNCDLNTLASLLYDYNRYKSREVEFFSKFFKNSDKTHRIEWYLDDASIRMSSGNLDESRIHKLSDLVNETGIHLTDTVTLKVFRTEHIRECKDTYGIILEFCKTGEISRWGYTSDTSYFPELSAQLELCDIGILNISDVYPKDVTGEKAKHSHLGFDGCKNMLDHVKWKVAFISEFCCMNGDYRHEIIRDLRSAIDNHDVLVFPAEKGLCVSIMGETIRCNFCGQDEDLYKIQCIKPKEEFEEVNYICKDCIM